MLSKTKARVLFAVSVSTVRFVTNPTFGITTFTLLLLLLPTPIPAFGKTFELRQTSAHRAQLWEKPPESPHLTFFLSGASCSVEPRINARHGTRGFSVLLSLSTLEGTRRSCSLQQLFAEAAAVAAGSGTLHT